MGFLVDASKGVCWGAVIGQVLARTALCVPSQLDRGSLSTCRERVYCLKLVHATIPDVMICEERACECANENNKCTHVHHPESRFRGK
jgi:hypothetical protein